MGEDPNERGSSRRWIIRECDASLRRLGTDWIDLYQVHRWGHDTDHDETLGALTDLVRAGKVRYIGTSTYPPSEIVAAQWAARAARPRAVRLRAAALLDARPRGRGRGAAGLRAVRARRHPVGAARQRLADRAWRKGKAAPESSRAGRLPQRYDLSLPENQRKLDAVNALAELADEAGMSLDAHGARLRRQPPGRHGCDHRPADDGASREPARRRRHASRRTPYSIGSTRSSRRERRSAASTPASCRLRSPTPRFAAAELAALRRSVPELRYPLRRLSSALPRWRPRTGRRR